ncbi:PQQ-binding-like beta-propeller repeat protein [Acidithiobacillus sp. AMEEHan]|uniref:outer membrane protein assembly factor BamB family protein n=1 Tax=Acidithiobacillus sp. AMEEHan TaxID=2994951 RepID=UPI0027E45F17|nr:PQQ-binding-like beta-propeller repeat protein [Acidithiobacillus sp. AMEEHan]
MSKTKTTHFLSTLSTAVILAFGVGSGFAHAEGSATTPTQWLSYALDSQHEAVYQSSLPGLSWTFVVPGAAHLDHRVLRTGTQVRNYVGFPIGVSVANGVVYAPNDNGMLYALDINSGRLLWQRNFYNEIMTTPIVAKVDGTNMVFIGVGDSVFSYSHAKNFGVGNAVVVRGNGVSGIAAVDAASGKLIWFHPTKGEDMPTPAFIHGSLIFGNGSGYVEALNPASGSIQWKREIRSFVSMSSATPASGGSIVVMGGTHPSQIYGIDSSNGKLLWVMRPKNVFSSSAGDGTLAADDQVAVGQIEIRRSDTPKGESLSEEFALDAQTGKLIWTRMLGQGKVPPRNKDAVPLISGTYVYTGSPVTHEEYKINIKNGEVSWASKMPAGMKGAPDDYHGIIIQALGNGDIVSLNASNGKIVHLFHYSHGGFGPQDGVIIGKTYIIGSNSGYLLAIPVSRLL